MFAVRIKDVKNVAAIIKKLKQKLHLGCSTFLFDFLGMN